MGKRDPEYIAELEYDQYLKMENESDVDAAYEEDLKRGRIKKAYAAKAIRSKNVKTGRTLLECQVYPVYGKGSGKPRKKPSEKAIRNLNEKYARRRFIRLCNINFGPGDIWGTFSFDQKHLPKDAEEMKKRVTSFIRKLQRMWVKESLPGKLKYIYVLEWEESGKKIRPHVHMLLSEGLDRDQIEKAWSYGSRNQTRRIYHDDDFMISGLGSYLAKNPKGSKRWYASRGLKRPDIRPRSFRKFNNRKIEKSIRDIQVMQRNFEKAYPGYRFLDAEVYYNVEHTGFYIYARMIRD